MTEITFCGTAQRRVPPRGGFDQQSRTLHITGTFALVRLASDSSRILSVSYLKAYICMYGYTYSKSMDQPGKAASPARGQLKRKNECFPCPRSCLRIWSRETGSAVPSRVSLLISIPRLNLVLTYGIPPEFRGGVRLFMYNRHTPSGQSRVYRVMQLHTDGVHCRESAGTAPVNLKVVPNECCLGRSP